MTESVRTFVLVHGSNVGGEVWNEVVALLRRAGHEAVAPTLTGLGERAHLLTPEVDLDAHIRDVIDVVERSHLARVSLVGHSYGGVVVTGVANRVPERIQQLIYLDAWAQDDGTSIAQLAPEVVESGKDGWKWHFPNAEQALTSWGITDENELKWWLDRLGPHPLATFEDVVALTNPAARKLPRCYILCTVGKPPRGPFHAFAERARSEPGWRYRELPTGHLPMSTMPQELVALLDACG